MPPINDGTCSDFGRYEPGFLDTLDKFFFYVGDARWPYWLALAVVIRAAVACA